MNLKSTVSIPSIPMTKNRTSLVGFFNMAMRDTQQTRARLLSRTARLFLFPPHSPGVPRQGLESHRDA